jgi:hypothetical protein
VHKGEFSVWGMEQTMHGLEFSVLGPEQTMQGLKQTM